MFENAIADVHRGFKPDLIIISAGFDAHLTDPLGQLLLDDDDFASMTKTVLKLG
jgi:acetoin utilization deacetylase AcuC-like enzyme